jgi:biotin carboxylase
MTSSSSRVLIVATTTGYQIRSFGDAAATLGVRLVFASDRCDQLEDPWWDHAIPVRFHDTARSADAIIAGLRGVDVKGVIAVGDRPVVLASDVARRLALPGNPPEAAAASRSKLAAREAFARAGLAVPRYAAFPRTADPAQIEAAIPFPAVVKPLALSGSRGVMRVNDSRELRAALERLSRLLDAADVRAEREPLHDRCLVESFIPGREYAVEGVLTHGRFHAFAIFDKPDPLDGPFFEETIYVTPSRAPARVQDRIIDAVGRGAAALGLCHGPVHAECRVHHDDVWMLEVAARPIGGLCSKALRFNRGTLEELLLRHALGEDVSNVTREAAASAVMMMPIPSRGVFKGVEGLDEARAVPGVDEILVTAKADTVVVPLPEGRSYLGFIFARADRPAGAERAVRLAHSRLRFGIEREIEVI